MSESGAMIYRWAKRACGPLIEKLETKVGKHVVHETIRSFASDQPFVLDIGCGARIYESHFPKLVGMDIVNHGGAQVIGDAHAIPFCSGAFDLIICSEVMEHLRAPSIAVGEMSRVLRSGGTLIVTMPFIYPIHEAPHDYQRLTEYGLRELLDEYFIVDRIQPLYTEEQTLAILLQRISFQRKDGMVRYYLYLALSHVIFRLGGNNASRQRYQDLGRTVPGAFLTACYLVVGQRRQN